jgi:site-specific DNA-methyltransferase (adenine-specific)
MIKLIKGDCLEKMADIPDGSVDMVLCDLPYGTTACKWDSVIPFEPLWAAYLRVCKPRAAIVLTAGQPFTSALVMSQPALFRYCWVWDKKVGRGHLVAKKRPMAQHEDIAVFYAQAPTYNPQMVEKDRPQRGKAMEHSRTTICGGETTGVQSDVIRTHSYPKTILHYPFVGRRDHPTQKPIALMEYLIRTYTNAGETVLDNTMGSGTTGVACVNTDRCFIGIERDDEYFKTASNRIDAATKQKTSLKLQLLAQL